MKKLILIIIAMFGLNVAFGQIVSWELTNDGTPSNVNANISAGNFTGGSGVSAITYGNSGAYTDNWTQDDSNTSSEDYFQITLTPNSGYAINITDINFGERRSSTGIHHYKVEYSLESDFSSNTIIATVDVPDDKNERIGNLTGLNIDVPDGSTIYIRWFGYGAELSGGTWRINDGTLTIGGTVTAVATNDNDTEVYDTNSQPVAANISSLVDTDEEAIEVFEMKLQDQGSGDDLATKVTNIRLKPHTTNTADWTDNIQGFVVYDANANTYNPTVTITDSTIDFAFGVGDLNVADNGTIDLYFDLYLNTSNIEDGKIISFMVDADDHGFTADNSGSIFVAPFTLGDFNSNDFTIEVEATELQFTQQPSNVEVLANMSPAVTVAYTDANGNIDIDADGLGVTATLSATGATLSSSTTTDGTPVDGIMTFSDIIFNTTGTGVKLTVTDSGGVIDTSITSAAFDVTGEQEIEIEGATNGNIIVAGNTVPEEDNDTLFGFVSIDGATSTQTYTIKNLGVLDLVLTDPSPYISIVGTGAGDFSISVIPTTPIAGSSSVNFEITFDPSVAGIRQATINIANNDANEDPYSFDIQGTGYDPCTQLFISEYANAVGGNYIEIYNPTNADVDMANFQVWRGYNGGAWSSADVIALSGTLAGGNVYVVAKDAADIPYANQYDSHLDFDGGDNIGLAWNGGSGSTFTLIDAVGDENGDPGTGWDVAGVANATLNHTLMRKSTVDYANTDWAASAGTDASDSEWVVLDYTTTTQLYHVSACQNIPLMAVVGHLPGAGNDELVIDELLAGPQTPKASNNTLFEDQRVGEERVSHSFRIYNAGTADLNLTGSPMVAISGANANQFSVSANPTSPVGANNGFTDFEITFTPTDYGVKTAIVSIANNNPFENPYVFTIQGTGINYTACEGEFNKQLLLEDFEDATIEYVTSMPEQSDGSGDYFTRTNGSDISASFNNIQGNSYFAAQDLDADGMSSPATLIFDDVVINSASNLTFSIFIAEDDDGSNQDWDGKASANDFLHIDYDFDNSGSFTNLLWVENDGSDFNSAPMIDTDFDGIGDGAVITDTFTEYTVSIPVTGNLLDIKITFGGLTSSEEDIAFDNIKLTGDTGTTTWNGTAWTNGVPTRTVKAIIDGNYNNGNIEACACQVNSGATLTVNAGEHLLIETDFENNGIVNVKDKGSIVQHKKDALITGTDKFKIHKTTDSYVSYDYIYWSSPMTTDTFDNVFAENLTANEGRRIYSFNTANFSDEFNGNYPQTTGSADTFDDNGDDWNMVGFSSVMTPGIGYIVMGTGSPFPLPSTLTYSEQIQKVTFQKGVINNGDITVPVVLDAYNVANNVGNSYNTNANLIGNPYPSAIDIAKLNTQVYDAADNTGGVLSGTFYFWTHDTAISSATTGPDLYNFTNDDYSTVTVPFNGTLGYAAGSNGTTATQYVSSGQGFFANVVNNNGAVNGSGTVKFTNNMRITDHNDTFRNTQNSAKNLDRVWLNLTKEDSGIFRQIMVGFEDLATDGFVNGQDGARMENGSNTDFYSIIPGDTKHYAIQNLNTFNTSKRVALGLEIIEDGTYKIDIDHVVGVFAEDQVVYLQDNETDTIWDLTNNGAYQFVVTIGDNINNRFVLRFTTTAAGITDNTIATQIIVAQNEQGFNLSTSDNTAIKSASVFNTIGQQLGYYKANNGEIQIPTSNINQGTVLFISVTLDNGTRLTKKVVKL